HAITLGYPGVSKSAVRRVLENCVYAGLIKVPVSISGAERYVKGIHEPIVPAADFWQCQEILGRKSSLKTTPKDEVPLRGILRHSCGASMTAGYSKGKKKYYLYYRCTKCSSLNVPGEKLHQKFHEVLNLLSLPITHITFLIKKVKEKINEFLSSKKTQAKTKAEELSLLETKIDNLEEKMVNNEIEGQTYKKWFKKYSIQKSVLQAEIVALNTDNAEDLRKIDKILPALSDFPGIFGKANIFQKHSILREVFKGGLIYVDGAFRTPRLHPALAHNELILKEKGLLFVEQSYQDLVLSTGCSEIGS
ncbi:MAG TPA: hypothetical protein VHC96_21830, partial [Puia sp.]|nr:hypothetical protein [Puia sp.]